MDIRTFLNTVNQKIKYEPVRYAITEELENHMQEAKEEHMRCGMEENEAEEKAVLQMGVAEEIGEKLNHVHRPKLDWKLFMLILMLMGFNLLVSILKQSSLNINCIQHTIFYMIIGIGLSIGIYFFDYQRLKKHSNFIFVLASFLVILPRLGMGILINGIDYVNFGLVWLKFTPSTIALPLYMIAMIGYLTEYTENGIWKVQIQNKIFCVKKDLLKIVILMVISIGFMFSMPSFVAGLLLGLVYMVLITVKIVQSKENCAKRLMILYGIIIGLGILFVLANPSRLTRIFHSFHPENEPQGYGYTGMLRKEVLENAKLIGEAQTKVISSNESIINHKDNYTFIYLVGKTGILVSGILVVVIFLTSLKVLINAKNIKERYGKLLMIGLSSLYMIQSVISVLMNVNLGIETNVNLPFVTYGGVYFVVNLTSFALILSIYRRKDIYAYEKKDSSSESTRVIHKKTS